MRRRLRTLTAARDGVSAVEFALLLTPLMLVLLGTLDIGYQAYLHSLADGALEKAARRATVGNQTKAQVTEIIKSEIRTILPLSSKEDTSAMTVTPLSYFNFSAIGGGERITGDTSPVGQYNAGDCYEDRNNNGSYDGNDSNNKFKSGGDDLGSADDIMFYKVVVSVPRLFPFLTTLGLPAKTNVEVKTLIRNQPFGEQQERIRCN